MGDFDTSQLLTDWDDVLARAGAVTATTGGVTFSGVWSQQTSLLEVLDDQLRNEKRFTVSSTFTELPTLPVVQQTLVRSGVTYVIDGAVRSDAELAVIEFDCKQII